MTLVMFTPANPSPEEKARRKLLFDTWVYVPVQCIKCYDKNTINVLYCSRNIKLIHTCNNCLYPTWKEEG